MNNLIRRTISGAGFVAATAAALLLGKYTFAALILFYLAALMHEFYRMTMGTRYHFSQILAILAGIILFMLTFFYKGFDFPGRLVILSVIPVFVVMINSLYVKDKTDFGKFANIYTGLIYIAVPLSLTNFVVFNHEGVYNGCLLLSFFIIVWASDVGGYLFGMALGQKYGKKLFPDISPKKSWIGFWGGFFLAGVAGAVLHYVGMIPYPVYHCVVMALVMNILGVYGDLFESQWKRHYCLKDSGHIMPGHGGLLDRLDSALFAIPTGVIYLMVINLL